MYRVLHVMPSADIGGISAVVLNYYRFIDRNKIHFDVVLTSDGEGLDAQNFKDLGSKIFHIPAKSKNYSEYESLLNYHYATAVIGCGELAGDRVFGKWNMRRQSGIGISQFH